MFTVLIFCLTVFESSYFLFFTISLLYIFSHSNDFTNKTSLYFLFNSFIVLSFACPEINPSLHLDLTSLILSCNFLFSASLKALNSELNFSLFVLSILESLFCASFKSFVHSFANSITGGI